MFRKIILLAILSLMLFSCYSHKIYLNSDKKSGRMVIDYSLDNDYLSVLSTALSSLQTGENEQSLDPNALIDEKIFRETFKNSKEVTLKTVKITSDKGYNGHIEITFTDFEKALKLLPAGILNITVSREGGNVSISQIINLSKIDSQGVFLDFLAQQKEDNIDFYNKLTKTAAFKFEIYTAAPMKKTEGVVLSSDGKRADYSFKLGDLLKDKNKDIKFLISL
jgi:hypothetical protein